MNAAGYPTSLIGMISATVTTIIDNPPTDELDDDPIEPATIILPPQFTPYPYKYRITLPTNSPASYGLLLLASR